ncbi:FAS1 domain-containing protein SELMODRAFT_448915-like [Primulina huaijiensis]|uniref:FAS1 domain-containing protein SELMODRAFT_448915-like n=1 Tax=Primulina huaijiensis TaxID=1492673 RepID=UPI003CC736C1
MSTSFFLRRLLLVAAIITTSLSVISVTERAPPPSKQPTSESPSHPPVTTPPPSVPPQNSTLIWTPPPPSPPRLTPVDTKESQMNKIIDALIGAGDFAGWANMLSSTDPSSLPLTATLFIPSNDAISQFQLPSATANPFLIPYHIVPQRLTFSDLRQFKTHTRLPTLLPSKYILITNNSPSNFTVDDSQITHPDIFVNPAFSLHGIKNVLDYSLYGNNGLLSPPKENKKKSPRPKSSPLPPKGSNQNFSGEVIVDLSSSASCSCTEFLVIFCVISAVFASKIYEVASYRT